MCLNRCLNGLNGADFSAHCHDNFHLKLIAINSTVKTADNKNKNFDRQYRSGNKNETNKFSKLKENEEEYLVITAKS